MSASINPATNWERAVARQTKKGMAKLEADVLKTTDELHELVARGIGKICAIGKMLEAMKRLAGHGGAIEAWAKVGYSQPQAAKYIEASKHEQLLRELQKRRDEPLGIAQAYKASIAEKRGELTFDSLDDSDFDQGGKVDQVLGAHRKAPKARPDLQPQVEKLIGALEIRRDEPGTIELIARLHSWSGAQLEEDAGE